MSFEGTMVWGAASRTMNCKDREQTIRVVDISSGMFLSLNVVYALNLFESIYGATLM